MNRCEVGNLKTSGTEIDYRVIKKARPQDFSKHCHEWYELIYFVDASGKYVIEDKSYRLSRGDVILIAPGKFHYLAVDSGSHYERLIVSFHAGFAGDAEQKAAEKGEFFPCADYPEISAEVEKLVKNITSYSGDEEMLLCKSVLTEIFLNIIHSPCAVFDSREENDSLSARAVRYISENMSKIENTDYVARAIFVSKSALQHSFRKNMGIPVMQYLRLKRLVTAKGLILSGENAVSAAEKVGYKDYSTFYRTFKSYYGYSPAKAKK